MQGVRLITHGGGTLGQTAILRIAPERGFAFVALTNSDAGGAFFQPLLKLAQKLYLGLEPPAEQTITLPPEVIAGYLGRYEHEMGDCLVRAGGGELVLEMINKPGFPTPQSPALPNPPPVRAAFTAEDRVIVLDPPFQGVRGEFLRGQQGQIEWLRIGGRLHRYLSGR